MQLRKVYFHLTLRAVYTEIYKYLIIHSVVALNTPSLAALIFGSLYIWTGEYSV